MVAQAARGGGGSGDFVGGSACSPTGGRAPHAPLGGPRVSRAVFFFPIGLARKTAVSYPLDAVARRVLGDSRRAQGVVVDPCVTLKEPLGFPASAPFFSLELSSCFQPWAAEQSVATLRQDATEPLPPFSANGFRRKGGSAPPSGPSDAVAAKDASSPAVRATLRSHPVVVGRGPTRQTGRSAGSVAVASRASRIFLAIAREIWCAAYIPSEDTLAFPVDFPPNPIRFPSSGGRLAPGRRGGLQGG